MATIEYTVIWNGRGSLPDTRVNRWTQRGSYLTDAGDGNSAAHGLPAAKELRGKGVCFDKAGLRNYNRAPGDRARLCLCGRGISDHDFAQGIHQCWSCRGKEERRMTLAKRVKA